MRPGLLRLSDYVGRFLFVLLQIGAIVTPRGVDAHEMKDQKHFLPEAVPIVGSLSEISIDEKLGTKLDLNLQFRDETGRSVTLGAYLAKGKPVVISPVYYLCSGLCDLHLNGFVSALKKLNNDWTIGNKFSYLTVSFDSAETPELALAKKEAYMTEYGRPEAKESWHFLTGDGANVQALTKSLGFKFKWDEQEKVWAHSSATIVISPEGIVTRYLPGVTFDPQDIKLALNESTEGKIGTFSDRLVLYCFKYDSSRGKYAFYVNHLVKMGGSFVILLILMIWLLPSWVRRE